MLLSVVLTLVLNVQAVAAAPSAAGPAQICFGSTPFAMAPEQLDAIAKKTPPSTFKLECTRAHQARLAADARIADELSGRTPAKEGSSLAKFVALSAMPATGPEELFRHAAKDQAERGCLSFIGGCGPSALLSADEKALYDAELSYEVIQTDVDDRAWLGSWVRSHGWFTIPTYGKDADTAAWLIVQHADEDPAFQKYVIGVLEPLAEGHETTRDGFAYLYDRWASSVHAPLRFGLGGECVKPGLWKPDPIEDPANVDSRRAWAGLDTLAKQVAEKSKACR